MLQSFDDVQDTFKAQGFHLDASSVLTNGLKPSLVDPSLLLEGILTTNPDDIQSVLNGNKSSGNNIAALSPAPASSRGRLSRILKYGILYRPGFIFKSSFKVRVISLVDRFFS